jgi:hypothetical protein
MGSKTRLMTWRSLPSVTTTDPPCSSCAASTDTRWTRSTNPSCRGLMDSARHLIGCLDWWILPATSSNVFEPSLLELNDVL